LFYSFLSIQFVEYFFDEYSTRAKRKQFAEVGKQVLASPCAEQSEESAYPP
jgi:hypothetical protein